MNKILLALLSLFVYACTNNNNQHQPAQSNNEKEKASVSEPIMDTTLLVGSWTPLIEDYKEGESRKPVSVFVYTNKNELFAHFYINNKWEKLYSGHYSFSADGKVLTKKYILYGKEIDTKAKVILLTNKLHIVEGIGADALPGQKKLIPYNDADFPFKY